MKAFVQRVKGPTRMLARSPDLTESIEESFDGVGLVVLLGWLKSDEGREDLAKAEKWIRERIQGLRIFPDAQGRMNLSLLDYCQENGTEGGLLWVPQFTLAGKLESGFRPSFTEAMDAHQAQERFVLWTKEAAFALLQHHGIFGGDMELSFTNWGPVSLLLEA